MEVHERLKDTNLLIPFVNDYSRISQYYRPMPKITHMTSVVDSEITCTTCRGEKFMFLKKERAVFKMYCPNCKGTGKMPSRTSEENYQLRREKSA